MSCYVQVQFPHGFRPPRHNDRRYTYLSDVRLAVGDRVEVPVNDGEDTRDAIVVAIERGDYPGPYDTVIRRVPADSTLTSERSAPGRRQAPGQLRAVTHLASDRVEIFGVSFTWRNTSDDTL